MAISAAVIGALKVALKKAAKEVAVQVGKEVAKNAGKEAIKATAKKALEEVARQAMKDSTAVILNRLKTAPTRAMFEFASHELGVPVKELKQVVKVFKQTPKMKDISKGTNFKDLARTKLKKELGVKHTDRIKDVTRRMQEENAKRKKERDTQEENFNPQVYSLLLEIQNELDAKVNGLSGATNEYKSGVKFNTDVMRFYSEEKKYKMTNVIALETILKNIVLDLERYLTNSHEDIIVIEEAPKQYNVYSRQSINEFITNTKNDTRLALR